MVKQKNKLKPKEETEKELLLEIRDMMKFFFRKEVNNEICKLSPAERKIYDLTGKMGQTKIKNSLNVAPNTVSNLWKKLEKMGILSKEGRTYKKIV